jgi:glucosylceramidase
MDKKIIALLAVILGTAWQLRAADGGGVEAWVTDPAADVLFKEQAPIPYGGARAGAPVIKIDPAEKYQTMDGFGFTLTGGSAQLISALPAEKRAALLKELFLPGGGIGVSYLRISIGASDLDAAAFSYDDMPEGKSDPEIAAFDFGPHKATLIPVLKEITALAPDIKILAVPWSAPAWMKHIRTTVGSSLLDSNSAAYARYFVKYVRAMKAEGITIDAVALQNEPLNPDNNPSMIMSAGKEREFVKNYLGPAFAKAGLKTKILVYDHNCDEPDYPLAVLADKDAAPYIDGSAFHLYAGDISALTKVHEAHPDKNVYFTEQWTGAPGDMAGDFRWHIREVVLGSARNWAKTALEWNLAADPAYGPHTPGGCDACLGALTIGKEIKRNPSYYIVAQAAKFVRPGSVRVGSNVPDGLPNAAFLTPGGALALIVLNDGDKPAAFTVEAGGKEFTAALNPGAAGTYVLR